MKNRACLEHIDDNVKSLAANQNLVTLASGKELCYDALVIACGLDLDYESIPGKPPPVVHKPHGLEQLQILMHQNNFKIV